MGSERSVHERWEIHKNLWSQEPDGKRLLGRPGHRQKDTIRINVTEVRWEGVDWMHLA